MKKSLLITLTLFQSLLLLGQNIPQQFVSTDITNFWAAFEKINATNDTLQQVKYLQELYIDKGSEGLKSLIEVRDYTPKEFLGWMTKYPNFWSSLKPNTLNCKDLYPEIEADIQKLKGIYPDLKLVPIYFSIGAFRTPGTTHKNKVLIGSEFSLADQTTNIDEFPDWRKTFYIDYQPRKNIALLCTHEYIHPQQKELVENLLSMCLYEGVAEFISCKATGKNSNSPAIEFGKANQEKVVKQYVADLFLMSNNYNWL